MKNVYGVRKGRTRTAICLAMCVSAVFFLKPASARAQKSNQKGDAHSVLSKEIISSQQRKITLDADDAPLLSALKKLAKKADVGISYQKSIIPDKKVTVHLKNVTVYKALSELLKDTDLKVVLPFSRDVLVIKKRKPLKLQLKQQETVSGTVTDAQTGQTLPGVNILEVGTSTGTATDAKGHYSLSVSSLQDSLRFSFVGYDTRRISIKGRTVINVALVPSVISGKELVVVGYGKQKKITTTGSISQISGKEISDIPVTSIGNALTGRIPGVTTIQTTGQPGLSNPKIYIRGVSTFNGTNPLVVIDGIPGTVEELQQLDPNSIKKISVLKDASATAVYGVRGANGVIIITTKKGREGNVKISADFSAGFQAPEDNFHVANGLQTLIAINHGYIRDGDSSKHVPKKLLQAYKTGNNPVIYPDNTWWQILSKNMSFQTKSHIQFNGGSNKAQYYLSFGYLKKNGLLNNNAVVGGPGKIYNFNYHRYNVVANINLNVTQTTNIKLNTRTKIESRRAPNSKGGLGSGGLDWNRMIAHNQPFQAAGIVDGKFVGHNQEYFPFLVEASLLGEVYGTGYRKFNNNRLKLNLKLQQKIYKGLDFEFNIAYNSGFGKKSVFNTSVPHYIPYYRTDIPNVNRIAGDSTIVFQRQGDLIRTNSWGGSYSISRNIYWQGILRYKKSIGKNNIGGVLVYNQSKNYYPTGVQFSNIPTGYVGSAARVTYNYNQRYLLEFDAGYNGSENFAVGRRYGFFPAISGGWVVSSEKFMGNIKFLNYLKVRASWGKVGNDRSGGQRFLYLPNTYAHTRSQLGSYNFGLNIPQNQLGVSVSTIGNPNVSWETAIKEDIGLDTRLFKNRLSITFDYFSELRKNILLQKKVLPIFVSSNASYPPYNIGRVRNHGYEIKVGWKHSSKKFSYNIVANWSYAKNKILYMDEVPPLEPYMAKTGHPIGSHLGYVVVGFYNKKNIASGKIPPNQFLSNPRPGDLIYKDINGDDVINVKDQKILGYPSIPQVTFGAQFSFQYKGFDIEMNWAGVTQVSKELSRVFKKPALINARGLLTWYLPLTWTPERAKKGVKGLVPRLSVDGSGSANYKTSTMWIRNASFLRLKNAQLGYTFSNKLLKKLGLRKLHVYLSGYNLLLIKSHEFRTLDPEKTPSARRNNYPIMRIFDMGFNIKF